MDAKTKLKSRLPKPRHVTVGSERAPHRSPLLR